MKRTQLLLTCVFCLLCTRAFFADEKTIGIGGSLFSAIPIENVLFNNSFGADLSLSLSVMKTFRVFGEAEFSQVKIEGVDEYSLCLPALQLGVCKNFSVAPTIMLGIAPSVGLTWALYRDDTNTVGKLGVNVLVTKVFVNSLKVSAFGGYHWYSNELYDGKLLDVLRFGVAIQKYYSISQ